MSYCRWSTDDFQCDLYIYEDVAGGYTIHVAGNKVVFPEDLPEYVDLTPETAEAWMERHQKVMAMIEHAERVPLNLPHDGDCFRLDTPTEAADKVQELMGMGYRCPPDVIEVLRAEAVDADLTAIGKFLEEER